MRLVSEKKFLTIDDGIELDCGARLAPVTIAYETLGGLSPARDNAVLVCHALSGDSHVAGFFPDDPEDARPGWWDIMVGPGKPIDTGRFFVVCANVIGGCQGSTGPGSENPATGRPYGLDFPVVTVHDMVQAQKRLMDHLGIERWHAVVGGSLGGMQALEWSLAFPEAMDRVVALATTMRHSALAIAFNEIARQAIMADPAWNKGGYYGAATPATGLAVARMIGHVTYLSDTALRQKFGRRLQNRQDFSFDFGVDFQVESYLRYQGSKFVNRFDANSFLYITKAADYFDICQRHGQGSGVKAFSKARTRYLVVSFTSDWLYPTAEAKEMVKAMKKNTLEVSFCEIKADCGHDAFLLPNPRLAELLAGFLDSKEKR